MQKVTNKLEEFFWLFLFINPFLDIGNGLFIMLMENLYDRTWEQINLAFTPSLLIRMTVLVLFGLYLLLSWDKRALLTIVPIGVVWVLSVAGQIFWPMDQFWWCFLSTGGSSSTKSSAVSGCCIRSTA